MLKLKNNEAVGPADAMHITRRPIQDVDSALGAAGNAAPCEPTKMAAITQVTPTNNSKKLSVAMFTVCLLLDIPLFLAT